MGIILAVLLAQFAHRSTPGDPTATAPTITSTGTKPGTGCVTLQTGGAAIAFVSITGTWTATLAFFGSNDGWVTTKVLGAYAVSSGTVSSTAVTTTTANGDWVVKLLGVREAGVCASAFTSGPASVRIDADPTAGGLASAGTGTVVFSANTETATGSALVLKGDVAAGAQPAVIIDNVTAQNSGKQILSVRTGGVEVANFDQAGELTLTPLAPSSQGEINLNGSGGGVISVATGVLIVSTDGSGLSSSAFTASASTTPGFVRNSNAGLYSGGNTVEHDFSAYRAVRATPAATLSLARTLVSNASTLTADSTITVDVVGSGGGNFVARLCSDGTTCGAGNIYLTCTQTCASVAGTVTACTVTKSAVSASTTLTWEVGTACATTDPGVNLVAHMTTP